MQPAASYLQQQRGIVLVVGLIMLLVMSLLAVSAARSTLLEERMSGSAVDSNVAFQAAEAALRAGELSLQVPVLPEFGDTGGRYRAIEHADPEQLPRWQQWATASEDSNWNRNASPYTGMHSAPPPLSQASAHYYLEKFPLVYGPGESLAADMPIDDLGFYRVTARGIGINGTTSVILQSTFKR